MSSLTHLPSRLPKLLPRRIGWTLPVPLPRHLSTTTSSSSSDQVRIMEVGGRDGLQNEKQTIPTETKVDFLRRLAKTGVRDIEAGSFVSSKWVPQVCVLIMFIDTDGIAKANDDCFFFLFRSPIFVTHP